MLLHKRTLIFLIFFIIGNQNLIAQTMMDIFVTEIIDLNSVEDKEFFLLNRHFFKTNYKIASFNNYIFLARDFQICFFIVFNKS